MTIPSLWAPATATIGTPDALAIEPCPLCGGRRSARLYRVANPSGRFPGAFELRRCSGCELVYVDPRPDDDALAGLYDEDFYFSTGWSYETLASWVIEFIQSRRRRRVERHVRPGRLLDIGSGDGRFVHHMARHGWDATGIDFSSAALEYARRIRSGGRFLQRALEDCDFPPGRLDLITLWQVLEHIGEPRSLLRRCHDLLKPGGMLVVSVPNIDGLSSRLTRERWWGLDVPRHLVHYSPATLTRALERAGFRVVRIRHRSLQYDPYALLHSSLDWVFTRRHFLSDFAKRHASGDMSGGEFLYNLTALVALAPVLAPLCVATTTVAALLGRGGFIEVHARRN
jgi:2-polyprenyl-3-methyl-5-hydroxy-6-metoxy-1,4-benzoquinol methylase